MVAAQTVTVETLNEIPQAFARHDLEAIIPVRVSVARARQQDLHPINQLEKLLSFFRGAIHWSSIPLVHRLDQRHLRELPKVFLSLRVAQIGPVHDSGL